PRWGRTATLHTSVHVLGAARSSGNPPPQQLDPPSPPGCIRPWLALAPPPLSPSHQRQPVVGQGTPARRRRPWPTPCGLPCLPPPSTRSGSPAPDRSTPLWVH